MKSKIYAVTINSRLVVEDVEVETEEQVCQKAFEMEIESAYETQVLGVRFEAGMRVMPWNSAYAQYCFGKGRITFQQLKEFCAIRIPQLQTH